jgi:hypothetical protein
MDHPLIKRPVLDEIGVVSNQQLDSVGEKHLPAWLQSHQ